LLGIKTFQNSQASDLILCGEGVN
jgi:hypothetical protein